MSFTETQYVKAAASRGQTLPDDNANVSWHLPLLGVNKPYEHCVYTHITQRKYLSSHHQCLLQTESDWWDRDFGSLSVNEKNCKEGPNSI